MNVAILPRCTSLVNPYSLLAALTFGVFIFYLLCVLTNRVNCTALLNRISLNLKTNKTPKSIEIQQTARIFDSLLRGRELWNC